MCIRDRSNLYANLGGMYKMNGKLELAKENMEQAIRIIDEYGLAYYHCLLYTSRCV